jgi:hypothetical protein
MQPAVLDAVLGNVGTMIAFRVGVQDASQVAMQLGDVAPQDLIRLPNHNAYTQMMIDGQKSRAFSMRTWPSPVADG